jgi:hypothetical protein
MLERNIRETGDQTLLEAPRSESTPVRGKEKLHGRAADESVWPRSPAPRELPFEEDADLGPQDRVASDEARHGWLRRHPIAIAFGLLYLLVPAAAGPYGGAHRYAGVIWSMTNRSREETAYAEGGRYDSL